MRQGFLFSIIIMLGISCFADTLVVDLNGGGDYLTIQSAIDAADPIDGLDTIIVSPGTYVENIYFKGKDIILTSTDPEDPEIVASTIIDGFGIYSVVRFSGTETPMCELKGFTITNGDAPSGGGISGGSYKNRTKATIVNCMITGNVANDGGGLHYCGGTITNCTIAGNTANDGGGLSYCDGTITNCIINGNTAGYYYCGGGLYLCAATITNCTIKDNTAGVFGGGLYNCFGPITNCTIKNNTAQSGGGLIGCDVPITNCTITGNTAERYDGGGLYGCNNMITNCIVSDNIANDSGGGLYSCTGTITNSTVIGNTANNSGGGLWSCKGTITNCIVWDNMAMSSGDQLYFSSTPSYSCIQDWTDGGTGNITSDPLFVNVSSSDPMQWDLRLLPSSDCIDAGTNTPPGGLSLADIEGFTRPFDGDSDGSPIADMGAYEFHDIPKEPYLHVMSISRLINFFAYEIGSNPANQSISVQNWGQQTLNWSLDLTGKPDWLTMSSITGALELGEIESITLSVDITRLSEGMYSYSFQVFDPIAQNSPQTVIVNLEVIGPIYVPSDYLTIQAAIDSAVNGDVIIVAEGVYKGEGNRDLDFKGKKITVQSTEPDYSSVVATTIIDCNGIGLDPHRAFYFHSSEDANSVINGFTIKNGYAYNGGGIHCDSSSPTIINCCFVDCVAENWGGGINCFNNSSTILSCSFTGNSAFEGGAITTRYYGHPIINNCQMFDNEASGSGGGINSDCLSSTIIKNCLIYDNYAGTYGGGGISIFQSNPTITGCTIVNNSSESAGCGILQWYGFADGSTLKNCIIWGNTALYGSSVTYDELSEPLILGPQITLGSEMTISYCDIENMWIHLLTGANLNLGEGLFDMDPLFVDPLNNNYHLSEYSMCINQGDPSYIPAANETDIDGQARIMLGQIDIGADEFNFNNAPVSNADENINAYAFLDGYAEIQLDGTGSYDEDGDELEYCWYNDAGGLIATGVKPNVLLPVGEHMIELIVNDGIEDSEPDSCVVTVIEATKVSMNLTPGTLNCRNEGNWVKAHFILPEEYSISDIDTDRGAVVDSYGIESALLEVAFNNKEKCVEITAFFDREVICSLASDWPEVFRVYGFFTDGNVYFSESGIRINPAGLKEVSEFASSWLLGDCGEPDWCGGLDLNRDAQVNMQDYPLLLNSEVEFTAK